MNCKCLYLFTTDENSTHFSPRSIDGILKCVIHKLLMWRAGADVDVDVVVFIISRHTSKENSHIFCFLLFVTVNGTHEPFEPFMLSLLGMEIDHDIATIFKLHQDEN